MLPLPSGQSPPVAVEQPSRGLPANYRLLRRSYVVKTPVARLRRR